MKKMFTGIRTFLSGLFYALRLILNASKLYFAMAILLSVLSGLYGVGQALFLKEIIDSLEQGGAFSHIAFYATLIILGFFLNKVVSRLLFGLNRIVTDQMGFALELDILKAMDHITATQMDDPQFHNELEQAKNLVKSQPMSILMNIFGLITDLVGIIGYVIILIQFQPIAPLVLILAAVFMFIINHRYEENVMSFLFTMSPERRKMNYYSGLLTGRDAYEEIKAYQSTGFFRNKYVESMEVQLKKAWGIFRQNGFLYIIAAFISYAGCAAIYLWILHQAHSLEIGIGSVVMYLSACISIQGLFAEVIDGCAALPASLTALNHYKHFTQKLGETDATSFPSLEGTPGNPEYAVEFRAVCFAYPGTDTMVLKDTSFAIRAGTTAALVGVNGAGKTTIARLIMGLYDNYSGCIYLNGKNIRALSQDERLKSISVLFQNYLKPSLTLSEAIALGGEIDPAAVKAALERSGSHEAPSIDTPLTKTFTNDGWIPSGGQWQKIALARMFYRNTECFLLDEPSAALDAQAELAMFETLATFHGDRTIIFITHRLASIVDADEVLFLSPGGLLIQDTHHNLMKNNDYNKLYRAQADRYATAEKTE